MSTPKRSIAKTASWRILAIIIMFVLAVLILDDVKTAIIFTTVVQTVKTVLYYIHERVWDKVKWGK